MSLASEVACCLIFEIPMLEVVSLESLEYASMMIGSHYSDFSRTSSAHPPTSVCFPAIKAIESLLYLSLRENQHFHHLLRKYDKTN